MDNDVELLFPMEDISNEIASAKDGITKEFEAADLQLANEIKTQKTIFDKKYLSVDEQTKRNAAELAELNRRDDKNWENILKLQEMMAQNDKGIEEVKEILAKNSKLLREKADSH